MVSRSVESMQSLNLVLNLIAFWALISSCENYDIFVTQPCCSPISVVSWSGRVYTVPQPRCSPFLSNNYDILGKIVSIKITFQNWSNGKIMPLNDKALTKPQQYICIFILLYTQISFV